MLYMAMGILTALLVDSMYTLNSFNALRLSQMSQKVCYLLTSPEKSQQKPGNGSYNTDSHTPTGKNIPAILKPSTDSYSRSVPRWPFPSEDFWENQTDAPESGTSGGTATDTQKLSEKINDPIELWLSKM